MKKLWLWIIIGLVVLVFLLALFTKERAPQPSINEASQTSTGNKENLSSGSGLLNKSINKSEEKETLSREGGKVLIALYVIGSDLESDGEAATFDFYEILRGYQSGSSQDRVDLIIAFGGSSKPGWEGIKYVSINELFQDAEDGIFGNGEYLYENKEVDMAEKETLKEFLDFVKTNYINKEKYDKKILIFWDHGNAYLGYGLNDLTNRELSVNDLAEALAVSNIKWDLIGFDACLMGNLEVAAYMKNFAHYMLASEETEPGHGWDYEAFIGYVTNNPDASVVDIAKKIIDSYIDNPQHVRGKTLSLLDLTQTDKVIDSVDSVFLDLQSLTSIENYQDIGTAIVQSKEFGKSKKNEIETSVDLEHMVKLIKQSNPSLSTKIDDLISKLNQFVVYARHDSVEPNSYGVSIYSPKNIVYLDKYVTVKLSPIYYEFLQKFNGLSSTDTENPEITQIGNNFQVQDNLGVAYVAEVYFFFDQNDIVILGMLEPEISSEGYYTLSEWNGEWFYLYDETTDTEALLAPIFEGETEDGKLLYSIEADLQRDNKVTPAVLYLEYDPSTDQIDLYGVPYQVTEEGDIIFSKEQIELRPGDKVTIYAQIISENENEEEWMDLGTVAITENTKVVFDYLPEGEYYYALYVEDFKGNEEVSEPIPVVLE